MVKNPPANAGDVGSIPGLGRSLGGGNGNPLQDSCLENSVGRGSWWAIVCGGVVKSQTQLSMHACIIYWPYVMGWPHVTTEEPGNHNLSMYPEMKEGLETVNIHHFGLPSSHHWVRKIILFRSRKTHCVFLKEDNHKVLTS